MQLTQHARILLKTLFTASSEGNPISRQRLARALGSDERRLACTLDRLDALGLVDGSRLRLTLSGLALAVALSGNVEASSLSNTPRRREAA